eukprot:scaffold350938_cov24-Prasinocladus_malaysianus.AAC.2
MLHGSSPQFRLACVSPVIHHIDQFILSISFQSFRPFICMPTINMYSCERTAVPRHSRVHQTSKS